MISFPPRLIEGYRAFTSQRLPTEQYSRCANIVTNTALIELVGANASLTDENGANALAHFRHNAFDGYFDLEVGRNFTTEGAFINEGGIAIFASDPAMIAEVAVTQIEGVDDGMDYGAGAITQRVSNHHGRVGQGIELNRQHRKFAAAEIGTGDRASQRHRGKHRDQHGRP